MTAALTVPAVDMQAILDGRQWLYLAPEKCDVCDWGRFDTNGPCERCGNGGSVPVVPPAPVTCPPDCGGWNCPRCGGSGTVPAPLLLCAEQCAFDTKSEPPYWHLCTHSKHPKVWETPRTAGLVLVPQPTYLPVVDVHTYDAAGVPCVLLLGDGAATKVYDDGNVGCSNEPYAPLLEPGGLLTVWDRAEVLDPPIVDVKCPQWATQGGLRRKFPFRWCREHEDTRCDGCDWSGRVPLSVGTGFTTVEVER